MTDFNESHFVVVQDASRNRWLSFRNPLKIFTTNHIKEVSDQLALVEVEVRKHRRYAAGFVNYEASPAFDAALPAKESNEVPLIWFAIFDAYKVLDFPCSPYPAEPCAHAHNQTSALSWSSLLKEEEYQTSLKKIKKYIKAGDAYQVNYSFRLQASTAANSSDDNWRFFVQMVHAQNLADQCGYCVYINTENWTVCSASPELFFEYRHRTLKSKPMKGTAARGLGYEDDNQIGFDLQHSDKNRAENIMITDMVRNDMSKIADIGSVQTTAVWALEKYHTFWTMTTTVQCQTDPKLTSIFAALFPAASITGAPKLRAMQIIDQLESCPRHIYTGSAGFVMPDDFAQFNVAIRTVLIDKTNEQAEFGVGGGIVWDSKSGDEFRECQTKAQVLIYSQPPFNLLETLKWCFDDGYVFLQQHLSRLRNSACYFSWSLDIDSIEHQLKSAQALFPKTAQRVSVQVSKSGNIIINHTDLIDLPESYKVKVADKPVNSKNYFLYHKTTCRDMYEHGQQSHDPSKLSPYDDVFLYNEKGELTESCRANILLETADGWVTPALSCGLLNGIGRQNLLTQGKVSEAIIPLDQLSLAKSVWLVNSVRGRWQAHLIC